MVVLTVTRHDEQGIVDPHTDADHRRQLGGEVRDAEEVGDEEHQRQSNPDTKQSCEDGEPHRQGRAECCEKDDHCGENADAFRSSRLLELGKLNE